MAKYCAYQQCDTTRKSHPELTFFSFPGGSKKERAEQWIKNCVRPDLLGLPPTILAKYRVCQRHFDASMFMNRLHNKLTHFAVPILDGIRESDQTSLPRPRPGRARSEPVDDDWQEKFLYSRHEETDYNFETVGSDEDSRLEESRLPRDPLELSSDVEDPLKLPTGFKDCPKDEPNSVLVESQELTDSPPCDLEDPLKLPTDDEDPLKNELLSIVVETQDLTDNPSCDLEDPLKLPPHCESFVHISTLKNEPYTLVPCQQHDTTDAAQTDCNLNDPLELFLNGNLCDADESTRELLSAERAKNAVLTSELAEVRARLRSATDTLSALRGDLSAAESAKVRLERANAALSRDTRLVSTVQGGAREGKHDLTEAVRGAARCECDAEGKARVERVLERVAREREQAEAWSKTSEVELDAARASVARLREYVGEWQARNEMWTAVQMSSATRGLADLYDARAEVKLVACELFFLLPRLVDDRPRVDKGCFGGDVTCGPACVGEVKRRADAEVAAHNAAVRTCNRHALGKLRVMRQVYRLFFAPHNLSKDVGPTEADDGCLLADGSTAEDESSNSSNPPDEAVAKRHRGEELDGFVIYQRKRRK